MEHALGAAVQRQRGFSGEVPPWLDNLPALPQMAAIWGALTELRNDLTHCGMNPQPASTDSILRRAQDTPDRLEALLQDIPGLAMAGGQVTIDIRTLYNNVARLEDLPAYIARAVELAGEGREVILTGQGPVWLYLAIAHALHGKARRLVYTSPASGEVLIFDHTAR